MFSKFFADRFSIILNTDSYKTSMFNQYPEGTEYVYSYIEARGGEYDETVFFGLQAAIKEYFLKPITLAQIDFAEHIITAHGCPFNREGWEYIVEKHNGYLPLEIRAVPEGTVVGTKNVLATVVNTDPKCYWLTTYVEPVLLRAAWYGTTVATNSYVSKQIIAKALERTGTPELIDFKLHDFGTRGVSSFESCVIGGMAHLVNFKGTDNLPALVGAMDYYHAADVVGFSIPAMEHSTVTSWGREREYDSYSNMLKHYAKPGALVACVSDAYDIYAACEAWGTTLKQQVLESGATIVVRPDSGDATSVIVKCAVILDKHFGSTVNDKGYKVLHPAVRLIQGDGIDHAALRSILFSLECAGYSADNIAFGQGGALLQGVNRDTSRFAMKCSSIVVDGMYVDVYKDPITDAGKKSKRGRMILVEGETGFRTVTSNDAEYYDPSALAETAPDSLVRVFSNGDIWTEYTFEQVRENSNK
jgi:nicotinamide phosphoribosyltransferase